MGSDAAFDTVILFNSRRVLSTLLAAPLADRLKSTVLRRYIKTTCPELRGIRSIRRRCLISRRALAYCAGSNIS
jgi:hypothetical protein